MIRFEKVVESGAPEIEVLRGLMLEYQTELGVDLCFQSFQEEMANLPGQYAPPSGLLVLILANSQPAGCIAIRQLDNTTCEMKRMYVRPDFRGQGIAKSACEFLISEARNLGYQEMKLDTLRTLTPAISLYQSLGFAECAAYNDGADLDIVYFSLKL